MRIQVIMPDKIVSKVDELAKDLGMSRSGLCSLMIRLSLPRENDDFEYSRFIDWIGNGYLNTDAVKQPLKARLSIAESADAG